MSLTHSLALTNTQMIPSTISHLIISLTTNDKKRIKTTSVSLPSYLLSYLPTYAQNIIHPSVGHGLVYCQLNA